MSLMPTMEDEIESLRSQIEFLSTVNESYEAEIARLTKERDSARAWAKLWKKCAKSVPIAWEEVSAW